MENVTLKYYGRFIVVLKFQIFVNTKTVLQQWSQGATISAVFFTHVAIPLFPKKYSSLLEYSDKYPITQNC